MKHLALLVLVALALLLDAASPSPQSSPSVSNNYYYSGNWYYGLPSASRNPAPSPREAGKPPQQEGSAQYRRGGDKEKGTANTVPNGNQIRTVIGHPSSDGNSDQNGEQASTDL